LPNQYGTMCPVLFQNDRILTCPTHDEFWHSSDLTMTRNSYPLGLMEISDFCFEVGRVSANRKGSFAHPARISRPVTKNLNCQAPESDGLQISKSIIDHGARRQWFVGIKTFM